jgi:hypothetical protein
MTTYERNRDAVVRGIRACKALTPAERKLAATRFLKNCRTMNNWGGEKNCYVSSFFYWMNSPEGYDYWSHIGTRVDGCHKYIKPAKPEQTKRCPTCKGKGMVPAKGGKR